MKLKLKAYRRSQALGPGYTVGSREVSAQDPVETAHGLRSMGYEARAVEGSDSVYSFYYESLFPCRGIVVTNAPQRALRPYAFGRKA